MTRPLCFVLMPFGKKQDASALTIDFDAVYQKLIRPGIEDADMEPIRADEEMTGGIIHKPMYERLMFCEYAVADLTTANANVFYELGVRHAVRPHSTVTVASEATRLPFDAGHLRTFLYRLTAAGQPDDIEHARRGLADRLRHARDAATDSPLFQLVEGWRPAPLDHAKTDVFREQVRYSEDVKRKLAQARKAGLEAVRAVEASLGSVKDAEAGVVIDLFLSYRSIKAWTDMIRVVEAMSPPLAATTMVQEQLALGLNRNGQGDEAERVLLELIKTRGPSSETYGILGRVYKDRWDAAVRAQDVLLARAMIDKAIGAYLRGFETDWRDAYPGVNAVALMEIRDPPDLRRTALLPIVRYAVDQKITRGSPDYWDWATVLELAVLASNEQEATDALATAVSLIREKWEPETTVRNIRLIREARARRNALEPWVKTVEEALSSRAS